MSSLSTAFFDQKFYLLGKNAFLKYKFLKVKPQQYKRYYQELLIDYYEEKYS